MHFLQAVPEAIKKNTEYASHINLMKETDFWTNSQMYGKTTPEYFLYAQSLIISKKTTI